MSTISPFRIDMPDADLADLHDRLDRTRWPVELPGVGWTRGVPLAYLRDLADYWRTGYDWRAQERRLNSFPQFSTGIDGANVRFLHVRSAEPRALPLIMTHGWPGSIAEFTEVIGALVDPGGHGGDPADAFHLVAPTIPGFGLSGPTPDAGWDVARIARAWAELMARLGYLRYGGQGGDWGHAITRELGVIDHDRVLGVHLNTLLTIPSGDPAELAALTEADLARLAQLAAADAEQAGYLRLQASRPQTVAYALTDSPIGQLAWIAEKFTEWTEAGVPRDGLLTNVMLYWLTRTAGSAANLYYEAFHPVAPPAPRPSTTPTGIAVFPYDAALPVRRLAERDNNIVRWTEFDRGGHFAAMEQPELFVADVRAFFRPLR